MKNIISTDKAPAALGAYSQGVTTEQLLFTAGQLGMDPANGQMVEGGIQAQTHRALDNLKAVVEAGGSSLEKVLKVTIFLADMNDFVAMNEIYGGYFKENPPARSAFQVAALPKAGLIEIECVATIK